MPMPRIWTTVPSYACTRFFSPSTISVMTRTLSPISMWWLLPLSNSLAIFWTNGSMFSSSCFHLGSSAIVTPLFNFCCVPGEEHFRHPSPFEGDGPRIKRSFKPAISMERFVPHPFRIPDKSGHKTGHRLDHTKRSRHPARENKISDRHFPKPEFFGQNVERSLIDPFVMAREKDDMFLLGPQHFAHRRGKPLPLGGQKHDE